MADRDDDEPLAHPHHPGVIAVIGAVLLDNRWPRNDVEGGASEVEVRAWACTTELALKRRQVRVGA